VRLYGELMKYKQDFSRTNYTKVVVEEGTPVEELLIILGIPSDQVGLVVVNKKVVQNDFRFISEDEVQIFPLVEGG